ncbi:UbiX family flavin prenyltransferase [bacterium]|nr:MAG: UbiX family flavin prenyltransferase [bacterium]
MDTQENASSGVPQTEVKTKEKSFAGEGKNIILGITGTSGAIFGLRMLRALIVSNINVDLILTEFAHYTLFKECGVELKQGNLQNIFPELLVHKSVVKFHNNLDLKSEIFMDWYTAYGMIVCPCAMDYVSGIANGESKTLIEKCADWTFSYGKPLIVVPRETPVNKIQLSNLIKIIEAGGKILPAMPSYEYNPQNFNDLADYIAKKALGLLIGDKETT